MKARAMATARAKRLLVAIRCLGLLLEKTVAS